VAQGRLQVGEAGAISSLIIQESKAKEKRERRRRVSTKKMLLKG